MWERRTRGTRTPPTSKSREKGVSLLSRLRLRVRQTSPSSIPTLTHVP